MPLTEVIKLLWLIYFSGFSPFNIHGSVRMFYTSNFVLEAIFSYIQVVRLDKPRFLRLFSSAIANKLHLWVRTFSPMEKVLISDRNIPICKMKIMGKNLFNQSARPSLTNLAKAEVSKSNSSAFKSHSLKLPKQEESIQNFPGNHKKNKCITIIVNWSSATIISITTLNCVIRMKLWS